jgi:hypothetical protein
MIKTNTSIFTGALVLARRQPLFDLMVKGQSHVDLVPKNGFWPITQQPVWSLGQKLVKLTCTHDSLAVEQGKHVLQAYPVLFIFVIYKFFLT